MARDNAATDGTLCTTWWLANVGRFPRLNTIMGAGTWAGTMELVILELSRSYRTSLLEHRRRPGLALASAVATSYMLGPRPAREEPCTA
jgi:hypothetical protein